MSMLQIKIKILEYAVDELNKHDYEFIALQIQDAIDIMKEQAAKIHALNMERTAAHYNNGWVPCDERLPEENGIYIICDCRTLNDTPWVRTAGFMLKSQSWCENHGEYYDDHYGRLHEQERIVAWMPLPVPWEGEKNETD